MWEAGNVLSSIGAVILVIYLKRWSIGPLFAIEHFLENCGFRRLVKPLRTINKACNPAEEQGKQINLIKSWIDNREELNEIIQHELRLLDEKDALENPKGRDGIMNPDNQTSLKTVND